MAGRVYDVQAGVETTIIFSLIDGNGALVTGQAGAVTKKLRDQDGDAIAGGIVVTVDEQGTSGFYEARLTTTKSAANGHAYLLQLQSPAATTDGALLQYDLRSFPSLLVVETVGSFFTSLAAVKEYSNITGTTKDALIVNLIARITRVMQDRMERQVLEGTWTEYHDGQNRPGLAVRERPIGSVTSLHESQDQVWDASTLYAATDYIVDKKRGLVWLKASAFADGFQNIRVIYVGGYATVPAALEHVATRMVARELKVGPTSEIQSMTLKDGSFSNATIQSARAGITKEDMDDMSPWIARRVA